MNSKTISELIKKKITICVKWLTIRENIALLLLVIVSISLFKIAFYGININSLYGDVDISNDLSVQPSYGSFDINVSGDVDVSGEIDAY